MTTAGWAYSYIDRWGDEQRGTLVGPDLERKEYALDEIKRRHPSATDIRLRRHGEEQDERAA